MAELAEPTDHAARVIELQGAHNLRDLGGLPTVDGRHTVSGRLFRSEFLASPDSHGADGSGSLLLKSVVDLRRTGELAHEQVPWERTGVTLFHCPLRLSRGTSWDAGYHRYLLDGAPEFVRAIRLLIDPDNQPALFHCAAGKDRTGVVAAVLLDLAGVQHREITHDYALTADTLDAVIGRLAVQAPYRPMLAGTPISDHVPAAQTMDDFLHWLHHEFGGAEQWLLQHGVEADEIADYRAVMLVD